MAAISGRFFYYDSLVWAILESSYSPMDLGLPAYQWLSQGLGHPDHTDIDVGPILTLQRAGTQVGTQPQGPTLLCCFFFFWLSLVLVEALGIFSCSTWDLIPWPGIKPGPLALGTPSHSHFISSKVPTLIFSHNSVFFPFLQDKALFI